MMDQIEQQKEQYRKPPQLLEQLLKKLTRSHVKLSFAGDIEEEFNAIAHDKGHLRAQLWYIFQPC